MKSRTRTVLNECKLYILIILLGAAAGAVLWCFLKVVEVCTELLWDTLPAATGVSYVPLIVCTAGGVITGIIHKKYGDYPEELPVVLGKIRHDKHYDYGPMPVMLVCAFLPLILGASVGPEAGLTGIIAGLCYWVGDNVKYAKEHAEEYSEIGAAITLAGIFHIPLFGIFAVEEKAADDESSQFSMPRVTKLLLYGLSIASSFLVMKGLGFLLGGVGEGFPSFGTAEASAADYVLMLVYIPVGLILFFLFTYVQKLLAFIADKVPTIIKETICGLCIGGMALLVPAVLFSGEKEMGMLEQQFLAYTPLMLIGTCLLKLVMTAFCIEFGLKGGHFFPLIYACACMGFGIALLFFGDVGTGNAVITGHAVFAAAIINAATIGAQIKKPIAVSMLLLICFPIRFVLWIFVAAALGSKVGAAILRTS